MAPPFKARGSSMNPYTACMCGVHKGRSCCLWHIALKLQTDPTYTATTTTTTRLSLLPAAAEIAYVWPAASSHKCTPFWSILSRQQHCSNICIHNTPTTCFNITPTSTTSMHADQFQSLICQSSMTPPGTLGSVAAATATLAT